MSKIFMEVTLQVVVESDLDNKDEIMEYLDFEVYSDNRDKVEVYSSEEKSCDITYSK